MSTDPSDEALRALQGVLAADGEHPAERGVAVALCGIVEMLGDDGEMYLQLLRSPSNLPVWRMLGMLDYIAADLRSRADSRFDDVDDDDGG